MPSVNIQMIQPGTIELPDPSNIRIPKKRREKFILTEERNEVGKSPSDPKPGPAARKRNRSSSSSLNNSSLQHQPAAKKPLLVEGKTLCTQCYEQFTERQFKRHNQIAHSLHCSYDCDRMFVDVPTLSHHLKSHQDEDQPPQPPAAGSTGRKRKTRGSSQSSDSPRFDGSLNNEKSRQEGERGGGRKRSASKKERNEDNVAPGTRRSERRKSCSGSGRLNLAEKEEVPAPVTPMRSVRRKSFSGRDYPSPKPKPPPKSPKRTERIPGEHLKIRSGDGRVYDLFKSDQEIKVFVDKDFVMEKSLKKEAGTKVFIEDMTKLMDDPETADFTLKIGNKSFQVHKAVLGARSGVFRTMFLSGMKEGVEGEAVITDVNEETLEEVLHYLYTGNLSGKDYGIYSLCYAANKYQLVTLMDMICEEIKSKKAELKVEEVAEVFISADMFRKEELFKVAMEKLLKNKDMMKDAKFKEKMNNASKDLLFKIMTSV